jgi:DNA polymerase-1
MDASTFLCRAFFFVRDHATSGGFPTGAIYGFTRSVLQLLEDRPISYLGLVFDSQEKTHRHEIYPQYKSNRLSANEDLIKQKGPVLEIMKALGILTLEVTGFEADDIIAGYAYKFVDEGHEAVIVSGSKNFYQLLSKNISMYDPASKKDSVLTLKTFKERFEGLVPSQFVEMQALMGDASDNIPGIPKVGVTGALKLIQSFQSLEGIYKEIDKVKSDKLRQRLIEYRESAEISRKLATLRENFMATIPLEDFALKGKDLSKLKELFHTFEISDFDHILHK